MLSNKFKDENFIFKFWLIVIVVLFAISYFFNIFTNKDPFDEYPYVISFMYFLPVTIFSINYIKKDRKFFLSFLVGFLIVTLLWLAFIAIVALGMLTIDYFPLEYRKMTIINALLTFFFITLPLVLFFIYGLLLYLIVPIFYFSDCFEKKQQFIFSELFTRKVFGDFAVNPLKLLFFYFTIPWRFFRFLLRKFLGVDK
jgi:hypothetical protein